MSDNIEERVKKIIANEPPELVARLVADIIEENKDLRGRIDKLEKAEAEKAQLTMLLEERVKLLRRAMFGRSSEKRVEATDRPRDQSQTEALMFSQAAFPSLETRDEKNKGKALGSDLGSTIVEHPMTETDLEEESRVREIAKPSPQQWRCTGLYDESVKIQIIERKYIRELHRRLKYRLKDEFNPNPDKEVIVTAPIAELLPGMNYTVDFVASVVADKYISHVPLERQTREMESLGLKGVRNSTLSRMSALAAASLEELQENILQEDLLSSDLALHLDETPWRIQNKNEKDGYMWVISSRYGSYYFFKPTRSGQVLKEKLAGYAGPALTDGFGGYNILEELGIAQGYCWAHARREFLPLESHDPTVKPILNDIDELFAIEREAKNFEELKKLRYEKSDPVTKRLLQRLLEEFPKSRPGSQKRKAIEYITKRWVGLTLFLKEIKLPLSNNEAERTIRHAVVGRKNYYGSGNHNGAHTAATLFTVIESCKKNDIDPRSFLLMSLQHVARGETLETPLAFARRTRSQ